MHRHVWARLCVSRNGIGEHGCLPDSRPNESKSSLWQNECMWGSRCLLQWMVNIEGKAHLSRKRTLHRHLQILERTIAVKTMPTEIAFAVEEARMRLCRNESHTDITRSPVQYSCDGRQSKPFRILLLHHWTAGGIPYTCQGRCLGVHYSASSFGPVQLAQK